MSILATPYRQIRAWQPTEATIVVFQAYNVAIASAAVAEQKLSASPKFSTSRMTWIKPSFYWCMYRSGWSFKDQNQARILAIEMKRSGFLALLSQGSLSHSSATATEAEDSHPPVRVQWDPERGILLDKLSYRSIQIGIGGSGRSTDLVTRWIDEWIVKITDITEDVRRWRGVLDGEDIPESERSASAQERRGQVEDEIQQKMPEEVFEIEEELRKRLGMVPPEE